MAHSVLRRFVQRGSTGSLSLTSMLQSNSRTPLVLMNLEPARMVMHLLITE